MKYAEYYAELKLPVLFITGSHRYFKGVDQENLEDSPSLQRENLAKTHLRVYSTSKEDKFEWLNKSPLGLLWRLPVVVYCGESIFKYHYLCEYEAKIENIYTLVCGPQDVLLGIKNKNKSGSLDCPFNCSFKRYICTIIVIRRYYFCA